MAHRKRLRNIWSCMRQRCNNPKHTAAHWYHDRGIRVCKEWDASFIAFESWALSNGYSDELTIDRIDPDSNYCPNNCRWIPRSLNSKLARRSATQMHSKEKVHQKITRARTHKPKTGRYMVVSYQRYAPFYHNTICKIEITGLKKSEALTAAKRMKADPCRIKDYSVRVSDGRKEGEYVRWGQMRQYISSKDI